VHADENAIIAFVDGGMSPDEMSQFRHHLDTCAECLAVVAHLVKDKPDLAPTLAAGSGLPRAVRHALAPGATVGPYVIERLIGAGGMGVVYAARDLRLDRTVALKLIRKEPALRETLGQRLRRESKALARLSHPNVTVIYELGEADNEIYVAMEYVAGTNLRTWLHEKKPTPREILALYSRAGRGLAAAHRAGLVHRDFKPDNVLVAADGSVKVTDFGLARLANEMFAPSEGDVAQTDQALTMTGAVVGTPAYMAPEQFGTHVIDARVDQFAFCVSLYEALYRERPFRGDTFEELRAAVRAGRVETPRSSVAPRIRRALLRGLSADPEKRFASMDDLLAAIAPRRGRVTLAALGLGVPATVALAAVLFARPTEKPCQGTAGEVAVVWNATRRAAVRNAFLATRAPGAGPAWAAVERSIDAYLSGWAAMHGGACEATRVHRQQSEAVLDLRMACLEHRRAELDALLGVFAHADADIVAHASDAVQGLHDLAPCADVESLTRRTPVPRDPATRLRYEALRARTARVFALIDVARFKDALAVIAEIEPRTAEFPTLEAGTLLLHARALFMQDDVAAAEPVLFRALVRAQAAREDLIVIDAAIDLAHVIGYRSQRMAEGLRWADFAEAALSARSTSDYATKARLSSVRAGILDRGGKLAEAEKAHRDAIAAARSNGNATLLAEVLDAYGANLAFQGKLREAIDALRQALAGRLAHYGNTHSLTASSRVNLANALASMRQFDEAQREYDAALSTLEIVFGAESLEVARVLSNVGQMQQEQGRLGDARKRLERALAIREKLLGLEHPQIARTLANLGYVELDEKQPARALALFERAERIVRAKLGDDHPDRSDALEGIAQALLALRRPAEAIAPIERAIALHEQRGGDPVALAALQATLAEALWTSGRDRARATKLAAAARKVLVEAGEDREVAELDAALRR